MLHTETPERHIRQNINKNITIFFGTETPATLHTAIQWGKNHSWNIVYTNLFDRGDVHAQYKFNTFDDSKHLHKKKHHELEYISMLLNIDLSLRCHAWIHTLQSNWNRIIDEMRLTVGGMYCI